ncbi:hypothetical protein V6N13_137774 [Hibiscus sabdariffa]|uniref:Uncharacterized protein n=1 Tax=Hibiscus sabdariffa TaxID=183260 RepID=A0ABR2DKJ6_9ROSI
MIFYDFTLRYDTLSIDNEREHARSHSYKVMDAYKRALYRCHVICTDLFSVSLCRNSWQPTGLCISLPQLLLVSASP